MTKAREDTNSSVSRLNGSVMDEANKFFLGARSAIKVGDMRAAERLLRRAAELSPNNYEYMVSLAQLLLQIGKNEAEVEDIILRISSTNILAVEPRLILANLYEKKGQPEKAEAILKGIVNLEANNFVVTRKLNQLNIVVDGAEWQDLRNQIVTNLVMDQPVFEDLNDAVREDETQPINPATTLEEFIPPPKAASLDHPVHLNNLSKSETMPSFTAYSPPPSFFSTDYVEHDTIQMLPSSMDSATAPYAQIKPPAQTKPLTFPGFDNPTLGDIPKEIFTTTNTPYTIPPLPIAQPVREEESFLSPYSQSVEDREVAEYMERLTTVEKIRSDILAQLPAWEMELELPEIAQPPLNTEYTELAEPLPSMNSLLDVKKVMAILHQFFFAVEEQVGRDSAFLLLQRAKGQLQGLYPVLNDFEIVEDLQIISHKATLPSLTTLHLTALATWMYLFITLLAETALTEQAYNQALQRALPQGNGTEEAIFRKQFSGIHA